MKKILPVLLVLLLMVGAVCLLTDSSAPAQALSNTSSRLYVAKNQSAGLPSDLILISESDHYTLYLPGSANAEALFFSWGEDTTVLDEGGTALESGAAPIALPGEAVTYNVNGGNRTIYTQQGSKDVRAMFLEVDEALDGFYTFAEMNNDGNKEKKAAGTMVFGGQDGYYFSIKGRGNSTWTYSRGKKPYNITLYKDATYDKKLSTELITGVEAKTWSLLANEGDQSLLRNKLGYDLASAMGIGLRSDFVDLYADGEYLGCYLMTPKNDYQAPDEGFILEIDNYVDNEDPQFGLEGFYDYHPTMEGYQNRFTVKENNTTLSTGEIQSYMQTVWDALLDEDSDDYLDYIDLDSWAKYYLLHEYYKSFDVVCGSILMHRDGTADSHKLIAGPVWDLDNSMGRNNNNADLGLSKEAQHSPEGWYIQNVETPSAYGSNPKVTHFWLQQLGRHESFMARVRQLFHENEMLFHSAASMLDQSTDRLSASAEMNFHLYGYSTGTAYLSSSDDCGCRATHTWEDYVYNLRNFATQRADFLTEGFRTEVVIWLQYDRATSGNTIPTIIGNYGAAYGTLPTPSKDGYTFRGWFTGPGGTGQQVTDTTVIDTLENHDLYAYWTANATVPTTTVPTTTVPGTTVPGTTVPGTTVPATTVPATTVPGTTPTAPTVPGTTAPIAPPVTTPGTTAPAPTVPGTTTVTPTIPQTTVPTTTVPGTTASGTTGIPGTTGVPGNQQESDPAAMALIPLLVAVFSIAGGVIFFYKKKR